VTGSPDQHAQYCCAPADAAPLFLLLVMPLTPLTNLNQLWPDTQAKFNNL